MNTWKIELYYTYICISNTHVIYDTTIQTTLKHIYILSYIFLSFNLHSTVLNTIQLASLKVANI